MRVMLGEAALTPAQLAVARRVIADESTRRTHLVIYLSGAHAYGFPSPDSDLDMKAIHIAPSRALLGLEPPRLTFDRAEVLDGVEIDYTSNELGPVLAGILQGNGNFIERVLGTTPLATSRWHESLRPLVRGVLSARVHRHYRGFAGSQMKALEQGATAKRALYVLRTALTGAHLLRSGDVVTDVTQLLDGDGFGGAKELITRKLAGEKIPLESAAADHWRKELGRAFSVLDEAEKRSVLPAEPRGVAALESWLAETRRAFFE